MIPDKIELNEQQKKQLTDLLFKSKLKYLLIATVYVCSLFLSNVACIVFGNWYLADRDPDIIMGFRFLCTLTNLAFLTLFFNRAMEANHDSVMSKIKQIVTK